MFEAVGARSNDVDGYHFQYDWKAPGPLLPLQAAGAAHPTCGRQAVMTLIRIGLTWYFVVGTCHEGSIWWPRMYGFSA